MAKRLIDADKLMEKLSRMIDYCNKDPKVNGLTAAEQAAHARNTEKLRDIIRELKQELDLRKVSMQEEK